MEARRCFSENVEWLTRVNDRRELAIDGQSLTCEDSVRDELPE